MHVFVHVYRNVCVFWRDETLWPLGTYSVKGLPGGRKVVVADGA